MSLVLVTCVVWGEAQADPPPGCRPRPTEVNLVDLGRRKSRDLDRRVDHDQLFEYDLRRVD
jgi:hypothetical protein